MGGDSQEKTAAAPLLAAEINQLLYDVARETYARADALAAQVDELEGEDDFAARLAELSRLEDELFAEFVEKLRELDDMVKRQLAALRASEDEEEDAAAVTTAASGVDEGPSAAETAV